MALPTGLKLLRAPVLSGAFAAAALLCCAARIHAANITIIPTFDSSITSDSNVATIEAGINAAIGRIEATIENPITVRIEFEEMTSGLGESSTFVGSIPYATYRNDLATKQTLSANDITALSTLPVSSTNPVNGNGDVRLTTPLLRALGESLGNIGTNNDGVISLNTSLMNLSRTGPPNGGKYDLQAVATHEMDEVLGTGGAGSVLQLMHAFSGQSPPTGPVGVLDLFRYSSAGVRSFSLNPSSTAYFSIDGGATNIVNFNQNGANGADFADWASSSTHRVQDAFGTPGIDLDLSSAETEAFDVVGYNLLGAGISVVSVPEPSSLLATGSMALAGLALAALRRRRA